MRTPVVVGDEVDGGGVGTPEPAAGLAVAVDGEIASFVQHGLPGVGRRGNVPLRSTDRWYARNPMVLPLSAVLTDATGGRAVRGSSRPHARDGTDGLCVRATA